MASTSFHAPSWRRLVRTLSLLLLTQPLLRYISCFDFGRKPQNFWAATDKSGQARPKRGAFLAQRGRKAEEMSFGLSSDVLAHPSSLSRHQHVDSQRRVRLCLPSPRCKCALFKVTICRKLPEMGKRASPLPLCFCNSVDSRSRHAPFHYLCDEMPNTPCWSRCVCVFVSLCCLS